MVRKGSVSERPERLGEGDLTTMNPTEMTDEDLEERIAYCMERFQHLSAEEIETRIKGMSREEKEEFVLDSFESQD